MEPSVRLIPLGGLGEIGLNMMLVESGDELIAIDRGPMFPEVCARWMLLRKGLRRSCQKNHAY